jgi:hypothetical protein
VSAQTEPFFEREQTKRAIQSIASDSEITLILGAGVSAESGLPPWQSLLESVLMRVAERLRLDLDDRALFVQALIENHGYLTSAGIAQSVLGREATLEAVRTALYERVGFNPTPGFHASTVADLVIQQVAERNAPVSVVTTNYDRLIEDAIRSKLSQFPAGSGSGFRPVTVTAGNVDVPQDALPVYHIHGCVPPVWDAHMREDFLGAEDNSVILGERDYALLQHGTGHWQDDKMHEVLSSGATCLFSGMSLADPNIIRYLTLETPRRTSGPRYALLSTQSEERWVGKLAPTVVGRYDEALRRRFADLRVKPVKADFYIQVSQFLSEILLFRSKGAAWTDELWYGSRLARWRTEMDAAVTHRKGEEFENCQALLNRELRRVVTAEVIPMLEGDGVDPPRHERFSLELWLRGVHSPSRSLELWGSSVSRWTDSADLAQPRIERGSTYSAVEAFMRGGPQFRRNGRPGSRWKYQVWQMIRLQPEPWFNLPVGVMVLSSNLPESESSLARLSHKCGRDLQNLVLETGVQLCDPGTAPVVLTGN